MGSHKLHIAGSPIKLHPSFSSPDFRKKRVLCSDPWNFVALWLKRNHKSKDAAFYWEQAYYFYQATQKLPELSAPLTSYYCFLNAAKALLSSREIDFKESHGVGGRRASNNASLANEIVDFQGSGILPAFCAALNEPNNAGHQFNLKEILWHIPFIHRAYCLSFTSDTELFIPLLNNAFMRKDQSKEAWFEAQIQKRYVNAHTRNVIEPGFELIEENKGDYIRRKKRFKWAGDDVAGSIDEFTKYHTKIRRRILPIYAPENRWYLKKAVKGHDQIKNSPLTLIFCAMHRLSELSRYDPMHLAKHMKTNHNWLVSEFVNMAPSQFAYGVAHEITGLDFIKPDAF